MTTLSILLVISIWVISIFTFAKYRVIHQIKNGRYGNALSDLGVNIYIKTSGSCILAWMFYILAS